MSNNSREQSRGILTKADREYLQDPDEYSRQAAYNREQAIRERLQRAFNDFPPLATELDDSVLDDLLAPEWQTKENEDGNTVTGSKLQSEVITLSHGVTFLLRAALATDRYDPAPGVGVESALSPFISELERGIERWLNQRHGLTGDVSVSVGVDDLQRVDTFVDELRDRDEPLTGHDRLEAAAQLSRAGYSTEEIAELVGERPDPNDDAANE